MNRWNLYVCLAACWLLPGAARADDNDETGGAATPVVDVQMLSAQRGREVIRGPADDPFFSRLHHREAAAMTGVTMEGKSIEQTRPFARDFFGQAVLEFTEDEADALTRQVAALVERFGDQYPLLVSGPWRFIKTRRDLCGGFSFTRADCIVLSERTLARFVRSVSDEAGGMAASLQSLLLHEQFHVLQRRRPELFRPLYENVFGFRKSVVKIHPWIDQRQVTNPDGTDENWIVLLTTSEDQPPKPCWIGTILVGDRSVPIMGRDFSGVAVQLEKVEEGYQMVVGADGVPVHQPLKEFEVLTSRFPIRLGYDHPNEVAAYLFSKMMMRPELDSDIAEVAAQVVRLSRDWLENTL